MRLRRPQPDPEKRAQILADVERNRVNREKGYREQALRLFPHVCGRCGREFSGAQLRELTVHHKDSNHMNNPPDGSNWELLCLYCHDNEHQTPEQRDHYDGSSKGLGSGPTLGYEAFEGLKDRFK
ncbi:MAG: HNH nuclease family protein [Candidatus Hydrogenedentes bacterium]|nr:HNH nuclease family protein [Candidatus Hydrogenedentota bacterium]MBI3117867.1 HNH nuclease family protein [Candidatus Hydrogenedentota bacterium]